MTKTFESEAITVVSHAFWHHIDPTRTLADLPSLAWVTLEAPEYRRNGLGKMVAKTLRYHFTDTDVYFCEAMVVGAECARARIVYTQDAPVLLGDYGDILDANPAVAQALRNLGLSPEQVGLGVVKAGEFGWSVQNTGQIIAFIELYGLRATWMESNYMEVAVANYEASQGQAQAFDWFNIGAEQ